MGNDPYIIERVQTGVRIEKRLLQVLRAFADFKDLSLGGLLEGIVLHAFDGKCPFGDESLKRIRDLKKFYGLDLDSRASHQLTEAPVRGGMSRQGPRSGKNSMPRKRHPLIAQRSSPGTGKPERKPRRDG